MRVPHQGRLRAPPIRPTALGDYRRIGFRHLVQASRRIRSNELPLDALIYGALVMVDAFPYIVAQRNMAECHAGVPVPQRIEFRHGFNFRDMIG